jgi:hypothetical protein
MLSITRSTAAMSSRRFLPSGVKTMSRDIWQIASDLDALALCRVFSGYNGSDGALTAC